MITTAELSSYTELAEASYVLWDDVGSFDDAFVREALLPRAGFEGAFAARQAQDFVTRWSLRHHLRNTASGFSGTFFQSKTQPGEFVLAIRGTEFFSRDSAANFGDIGLDGIAMEQVVDLYNYWNALNTEKGTAYQAARLVTLTTQTIALNAAYAVSTKVGIAYEGTLRSQGYLIDYGLGPRTVRTVEVGSSRQNGFRSVRGGPPPR